MALDLRKFLARFVDEAREHLSTMADGFAALDRNPADRGALDGVFRSAHTIKGSSKMLKLEAVNETAHRVEDLLDALRAGRLSWDDALASLLDRGLEALGRLVESLASNLSAGAGAAEIVSDSALLEALALPLRGIDGDRDLVASGGGLAQAASGEAAIAPEKTMRAAIAVAVADEPAADPKPSPEAVMRAPDTVRIRIEKIDELVKLMGEVVSTHGRSLQRIADLREIRKSRRAGNEAEGSALAREREAFDRFAKVLRDDVIAQERLMSELHAKALVMRMLPLSLVFEPSARMVREIARSLGKEAECSVTGSGIELDRHMIEKIGDPVLHLLRNAVDHGIETPAERAAAGKPVKGRVSLSARQDGGWVALEIADDGKGIDVAAIRDKALRKGLLSAEKLATMKQEEIVDLIFLPGFSTSPIITDLSGRGVGLDVVKRSVVDDLRGIVSVESNPGGGTRFSLRLPISLAVMRVLVVKVGKESYGFAAQYVSELVRAREEEFRDIAGRRALIVRNEFVPVIRLAELLGLEEPGAPRGRKTARDGEAGFELLLVARSRGEKIALTIDGLVDERDMVIKPLPKHMRGVAMVSGIVMTGKSELLSVLHVPALVELARRARGDTTGGEISTPGAPIKVLVVDDSLNTREIERDVLEAHGYAVTLAEDGVDGLGKALSGDFDAVLTDIEMPGMDGFTLTERLREDERYRDTPIIMVTSRQKEEDKRRGIKVGADAYIVKGDFEQGNLVETLRRLGL